MKNEYLRLIDTMDKLLEETNNSYTHLIEGNSSDFKTVQEYSTCVLQYNKDIKRIKELLLDIYHSTITEDDIPF